MTGLRQDRIDLQGAKAGSPDYILISPGPKDPAHAGISIPLVRAFSGKAPIFGVCLGMQCINEAFEGRTIPSPRPMHGKTSLISHEGKGLFKDVPGPFRAARYHSLISEKISDDLVVTARSDDGFIMGLSHCTLPVHGVQFHPESFLTEHGYLLIENFLGLGPMKGVRYHG